MIFYVPHMTTQIEQNHESKLGTSLILGIVCGRSGSGCKGVSISGDKLWEVWSHICDSLG